MVDVVRFFINIFDPVTLALGLVLGFIYVRFAKSIMVSLIVSLVVAFGFAIFLYEARPTATGGLFFMYFFSRFISLFGMAYLIRLFKSARSAPITKHKKN